MTEPYGYKEPVTDDELVELIDREADMLNRGRPEASLDGIF